MVAMKTRRAIWTVGFAVVCAWGCKIIVSPTINVPAAESAAAIERSASGEAPAPKAGQLGGSALEQAVGGRRTRTAEIQGLKNNRIVGESHNGYLEIRDLPPGEYGQYARQLVDAENKDRRTIYYDQAAQMNLPTGQIEASSAKVIYDRSFRGEWVEESQDGNWVWTQKANDRAESAPAK